MDAYTRTPQEPVGSGFGAKSTATEVLDGVDLTGRFAVVTGGYSGIGLETTRALVGAGADVLVPWQATRCVARWSAGDRARKGAARWRAVAEAAAKQSRRAWVPEVSEVRSTAEVATLLAGVGRALVLHEEAAVAAARAAYVAGFATSSNLAARQRYGVPTAGTSARAVGPSSRASDFDQPTIPGRTVFDRARLSIGSRTVDEVTVTMRPAGLRSRWGRQSLVRFTMETRRSRTAASTFAASSSDAVARDGPPELFTRMSTPP